MKIFILDSGNNKVEIETNENEYIRDIKKKLRTKMGINPNITLHYNGEILEDNEKVSDYEIENNSYIVYSGIFREDLKNNMKIVIIDSKNNKEEIEINENEYIRDIKNKLKTKKGINSDITLHYNGEILEDNEIVSSYDIENNSQIFYIGTLS